MNKKNTKNISDEELCKLASEIRKLEKRINKNEKITNDEKKSYDFLFDRIYSIINWYNIEIIDYTWKKFISWMNWFDIVWSEYDDSLDFDIVWRTITPMIKIDWKIIQKSKIIIKTPDELEGNGWDHSNKKIPTKWLITILCLITSIAVITIWFLFSCNIVNWILNIIINFILK